MRKIIPPSLKNERGEYVRQSSSPLEDPMPQKVLKPNEDLSIDELMGNGLLAINRILHQVLIETSTGITSRETVQNLKDVMIMLRDLKKDEQDLLTKMSDEELENLVK